MTVLTLCGIAISGEFLRLDVTWSGIFYTRRSANNSTLFFLFIGQIVGYT